MKKIKLFTLLLLLFAFSSFSVGQVGFQVGYLGAATNSGNANSAYSPGINLGLTYDHVLTDFMSVLSGVNYTYGWQKNGNAKNHDIDVPVRFALGVPLGDLRIFGFTGPKFVYNVAGSRAKANLPRFDIKMGFGGGLKYYDLTVKVGYDLGLLNQASNGNYKINHLNFSIGYDF